MEKQSSTKEIFWEGNYAWLPGAQAAVTIGSSKEVAEEPEGKPAEIKAKGAKRGVVPWGTTNDQPKQIRDKVEKSELVSTNMLYNLSVAYGGGIEFGTIERKDNGLKYLIPGNFPQVQEFFEENDMSQYLLQMVTDMNFFYNAYAEIILNQETSRQAVVLQAKEAIFSRLEEADPKDGVVKGHFYSAKWGGQVSEDDVIFSPVLNKNWPARDALIRTGKIAGPDGKTKDLQEPRFIIPVNFPTPGRTYYSKPYWWSIFESGWYDFAVAIPQFKAALMKNQMTLKYHIEFRDDYFEYIFDREGITEEKAKRERITLEFTNLNNFLSDAKNSGKSVISFFDKSDQGELSSRMKIKTLENPLRGGEYIQDSEEASNILCYAMGVHPSIIGAAPGKNKAINGTEARELFIIKQALMQPFRDRILRPLYVIKALNNWPKEVHFAIPNLQLTTLDRGKGSEKNIS